MRVFPLPHADLPEELASALRSFEDRFPIELGDDLVVYRRHHRDHTRFFRSMGPALYLVVEDEGSVIGTAGAAFKPLLLPGGRVRRAAYVGNFRVAPEARYGPALLKLQRTCLRWIVRRCFCAFSVVHASVQRTPDRFTGRFRVPRLSRVAPLALMKASTSGFAGLPNGCVSSEATVRALHRRLSRDRITTIGGDPTARSLGEPLWLALPDGSACACLEDTRRTKSLVCRDRGTEVLWMYLSYFAARSDEDAARLWAHALTHAAEQGVDTLYGATDPKLAQSIAAELGENVVRLDQADIYAYSLLGIPDAPWTLHAGELI